MYFATRPHSDLSRGPFTAAASVLISDHQRGAVAAQVRASKTSSRDTVQRSGRGTCIEGKEHQEGDKPLVPS